MSVAPRSHAATGFQGVSTIHLSIAGVPVRLESNSPDVIAAAAVRHSWKHDGQGKSTSRPSGDNDGDAAAECLLSVTLRDDQMPGPTDVAWTFRTPSDAEVVANGLRAVVDLRKGSARVEITASFLARLGTFRRCVLEGIPFALLTRRDRHPVHASAIRDGDATLLLHGLSGVGKSTLVYVAHRAGLMVLADDACRVQLVPELRVWGDTPVPRVHLLEEARNDFPELRDCEAAWTSAGGVQKLEVEIPLSAVLPYARRALVCLLSRDPDAGDGGGSSGVSRRIASPRELRDSLLLSPGSALDLNPDARDAVATALAADGGWHLALSSDPREAIPHLRAMLQSVVGVDSTDPC